MNNSIPLILASKSKPRRDVLFSAGICPTIRERGRAGGART